MIAHRPPSPVLSPVEGRAVSTDPERADLGERLAALFSVLAIAGALLPALDPQPSTPVLVVGCALLAPFVVGSAVAVVVVAFWFLLWVATGRGLDW